MNWITYSLLMFSSSVALYLLIRKAQLLKIPYQIYSLAMFAVPIFGYSGMMLIQNKSFVMSAHGFWVIIFMSLFCAYLGNLLSMKAIDIAPNPGYSLILSKSYVIFTSIASVFLFQSDLNTKSIIAILLIVGFSALISISPKTHKSDTKWIWYSMGAFFCWGGIALISKYLIDIGVDILARLLYVTVIVSILLLGESYYKKINFSFINKHWILLFFIGILASLFNFFMQLGYQTAPNPGYINATNAASISLLTLFSAYFFKDELNIRKMIGVIGVTVGMILLFV